MKTETNECRHEPEDPQRDHPSALITLLDEIECVEPDSFADEPKPHLIYHPAVYRPADANTVTTRQLPTV